MKALGVFLVIAAGLTVLFPAVALYVGLGVAVMAAIGTIAATRRVLHPGVVITALVLGAWLVHTVLTPAPAPVPAKTATKALALVVFPPATQDTVERAALASLRGADAHRRMSVQERTWAADKAKLVAAKAEAERRAYIASVYARAEGRALEAERQRLALRRAQEDADRARRAATQARIHADVSARFGARDAVSAQVTAQDADRYAREAEAQVDALRLAAFATNNRLRP